MCYDTPEPVRTRPGHRHTGTPAHRDAATPRHRDTGTRQSGSGRGGDCISLGCIDYRLVYVQ